MYNERIKREKETIQKNGASPKSQMSRGNLVFIRIKEVIYE
jgi:hypothetical protein